MDGAGGKGTVGRPSCTKAGYSIWEREGETGMLEETLRNGFQQMGLSVPEKTLGQFRRYYEALCEGNRVMNLTAISGEDESARGHFLDSAAPALRFPLEGARVVDVGTGAGLPGVPLKLLCPSISLTLLDSQRKRVDFLRGVCASLGLDGVECIQARAEEPGERREQYDYAVSRAVARLNILCELCLPYVRPGGVFLALKGPVAAEELEEARHAIALLGGRAEPLYPYEVPGTDFHHILVAIRKTGSTPRGYPRPFAKIKKSPL